MKKGLNRTDRFLILLFLCCTVGVAWRFWELRRGSTAADLELVLQAEWRGVDVRTAECLSEGDLLYTVSGEYYGRVERISLASAAIRLSDGGRVYEGTAPLEEKCDVRITVGFMGSEREGVLLHGGTVPIAVGERLSLYTERCELSLFVMFCGEKTLFMW